MAPKPQNVVTQSNRLIEASYKLNLEEKRLVIAAISKLDPRREFQETITVTAEEYAQLFGLDINAAYQQIKDAAFRLYDRTIKINWANAEDKPIDDEMRWIWRRALYRPKTGKVEIAFSPSLIPYLSQLKEQFTSYKLVNVRLLRSVYSIRLYEVLTQFHSAGQRCFSLDEFRTIFALHDKYPRYSEIKRWVIDPAIKELTKKSNYVVKFKPEKKGKAVQRLCFSFKEKPQLQMDL